MRVPSRGCRARRGASRRGRERRERCAWRRRRSSSRGRPRRRRRRRAPASVSIDVRQRTGTVTWSAEAGAPAVARRRRTRRRRGSTTTGALGVANATSCERGRRARRAPTSMSGVWNAPPTLSARRAAHAELLGAARSRARRRRAFPRSRPGRARCRWRPSTRRARPRTLRSACSIVAPSSAAMRPGCASAAACVELGARAPRSARRRRGRARPTRSSAVTWPSECPRTRRRRRRSGRSASHATSDVHSTASCASRVRASARPARRARAARAVRRARPRPARRSSTRGGPATARPCRVPAFPGRGTRSRRARETSGGERTWRLDACGDQQLHSHVTSRPRPRERRSDAKYPYLRPEQSRVPDAPVASRSVKRARRATPATLATAWRPHHFISSGQVLASHRVTRRPEGFRRRSRARGQDMIGSGATARVRSGGRKAGFVGVAVAAVAVLGAPVGAEPSTPTMPSALMITSATAGKQNAVITFKRPQTDGGVLDRQLPDHVPVERRRSHRDRERAKSPVTVNSMSVGKKYTCRIRSRRTNFGIGNRAPPPSSRRSCRWHLRGRGCRKRRADRRAPAKLEAVKVGSRPSTSAAARVCDARPGQVHVE